MQAMQAVALVFEHVLIYHDGEALVMSDGEDQDSRDSGASVLADHGSANAALKLLDDLCMMATGASQYCSVITASQHEPNHPCRCAQLTMRQC